MAITTRVARHYAIRLTVIAIISVLFFLWGAYDLWVKIPRENALAQQFAQLDEERKALEAKGVLTAAEAARHETLSSRMVELSDGGKSPAPASPFDHVVCWFFMACLPLAPYYFWRLHQARRRVYRLEDDGTLVTPEGRWGPDEVADMDMSRWQAKSIAWVVHRDGRRVKLDDYVHRDLHVIVGHFASRLHRGQWDAQAKPIKPARDDGNDDAAPEDHAADAGAGGETESQGEAAGAGEGEDGPGDEGGEGTRIT